MEQTTNPKHYATANGKDLFALMEDGLLTPDQYTGFLVGNITKYLHRAEQKNGAEDLAKAGAYLATLGVKLYGVDFGPLLLEAVGAQLDKHTQPTTLVDEDDLDQSVLEVIKSLNDEDLVTLADAATVAVRNDHHTYQQYFCIVLDDERRNIIDLTFDNRSDLEDYEDLKKYAPAITKRLSGINTQSLEDDTDQGESPVQPSTRGLNLDVLSTIHALDVDDLTTLAGLCDEALEAGPGNWEYLTKAPREDLKLLDRVVNSTVQFKVREVTDLLIDFRDHVKEHLQAVKQAERVKEDEATDPVLEYLTDEANVGDFNTVRDLYREMLYAGITNSDDARKYLTYSDNNEAKDALIRCFRNLKYSSDWADMVKYFGPVVTSQLQAEADEEAKALEANTEPELENKLNPVELSALKKAYRNIIELDTVDKRVKYFQANNSWLGVPLIRAFNNDTYREDVTELLNWGFYNVTAGLPLTKSTRTEDAEDLELLNRAYHLMLFSYTKEERAKAISESSESGFSWDESRKVAYITSHLLGDNISCKISEDVINYFIDNPDQATYK